MEKFLVWLRNTAHVHERMMADFLRKRGWVVFYLDEEARNCHEDGFCWLKLYNDTQR